jgi:NB-ARC domain/Rx N-terminal domain
MTSHFVSMMQMAVKKASNLVYRSGRDDLKIEVEKLDRKLRRIQATIEEVEQREIHDKTVKLWVQELKYLASNAGNVLDEYHYELLRCQFEVKPDVTVTLFSKVAGMIDDSGPSIDKVNCICPAEIIEKIRQINSQFEEISKDRKALQLTDEEGKRKGGACSINLPSSGHLMNTDSIFGRSNEKKELIDFLLSGVLWDEERKEQLRLIPILGMGGIGKTTLAQMVYSELQSMFDVKAWVYVSPEFDIIRITKEISEVVTGNFGNSFDGFNKIQEVLQKELMGKKMLLVLDDVWSAQPNDWETLFFPLRAAKLVRVLVTSRSNDVVQVLNRVTAYQLNVIPHRLHILPKHESLNLFYNCAIADTKNINQETWLTDIGCQIIKRCGGLPLAIKCIGGALRYNENKESWMEILNSEFWESNELEPVFRALKVSYYQLPPKLRECFLFCSLFPKGSRLCKISIIYMWMANGFIHPKKRKTAENLGEEYLDELQMRSFIVSCTKGSFRLHDVIYDLAKSISEGEIHTIMDEKSNRIPDKIRHLYIKKGNEPSQSLRTHTLRTLFNATLIRNYNYSTDLHDIRSVRVLGLIGSNVFALIHSPLKHLRYLGIMEFDGTILPESLCLLYHLQTLEITHCYHLRELPVNIANLVNLRYLYIAHAGIKELPVTLWKIHNLHILHLKKCCNFRVLPPGISNLKNLWILQLKACKQLEELPIDMGHLINLKLLNLSLSGIRTLPASIGLLKSTKFVFVGLSDNVCKQLKRCINFFI